MDQSPLKAVAISQHKKIISTFNIFVQNEFIIIKSFYSNY